MARNIGNFLQLSTEEQDSGSIVFKVPEATSCAFDGLNSAITTFAHCVGNTMSNIRKNTLKVPSFRLTDELHIRLLSIIAIVLQWQQNQDLSATSKFARETLVLVPLGLPCRRSTQRYQVSNWTGSSTQQPLCARTASDSCLCRW